MDNNLRSGKIILEQHRLNPAICSPKEYIWKNISKLETLRKESSIRKSQTLCQNLQIKLK